MSFQLVKKVIRSEQQSPAHKLVLIVIADHTNETKSGTAWPSVETIAAYVGLKRRQVQRILRDLEATGQIKVWKRSAMMGANRYQIIVQGVSPMTRGGVTHDTSDVSYKTRGGVTHDTQVHKEQKILNKVGGAPGSAEGATASHTKQNDNSGDAVTANADDTPECTEHPYRYENGCAICYAQKVNESRKEPEA